jgi:hypothetical protein
MIDFANFVQRKQTLQARYDRLIELIEQGEVVPEPAADLALLRKTRDELAGGLLFRVLCVGDFSTGKSSFINRFLLERELLPAWSTPTTALPTQIRFGEQVRAIRFRPSTREGIDLEEEVITDEVAERLRDWVSAANKDHAEEGVFQVIVETPASRLAAGVEVVDAPGLNDPNPERMKLTTIGAFITGAPAATASSFMLFGVPAIAIGGLLLAGAFFLKKESQAKLIQQARDACAELAGRIEEEKWKTLDQLRAQQAQRIDQICANVDNDIGRAWRERLAELDAIARIEDQGAALRALRDELDRLTLRVNP